jgi:GTPase involved in cell partitioning and DNA repair
MLACILPYCPAGHHPRAAGGSGAPGGSVVLRATTQLTGLGSIPLHVEAERGGPGGKQWMDGKRGADKVRNHARYSMHRT